jgi:N-acetylglucosamine-6-phosphate deacetylase
LIKKALATKKAPSIGHSQATYADFLKCYEMGVRHMTHYPNAMSELHHREIGLMGAGLIKRDLHLEVIADGIHSSLDFLKLLLAVRGPDFGLASDMIPPAYTGHTEFDGRRLSRSGKRFTTDEGVLAGGGTEIAEQVQWLWKAGIPPDHLVPLACLNTVAAFGLPLPRLEEQAPASFLVLDDDFNVSEVYHCGERL